MKKTLKKQLLVAFVLLLQFQIQAQVKNQISKSKPEQTMKQVLIDKLTVPATAKEEFLQRMNANRAIIQQQPGFVKDDVYVQQDANGNFIFITVAVWENAETINKAKEVVQAEYKRIGFNLAEFCQKLNIKIERGIYEPFSN